MYHHSRIKWLIHRTKYHSWTTCNVWNTLPWVTVDIWPYEDSWQQVESSSKTTKNKHGDKNNIIGKGSNSNAVLTNVVHQVWVSVGVYVEQNTLKYHTTEPLRRWQKYIILLPAAKDWTQVNYIKCSMKYWNHCGAVWIVYWLVFLLRR